MNKKKLVIAIACAMGMGGGQQVLAANDLEISSVTGLIYVDQTTELDGSESFVTTNDTAQLGTGDLINGLSSSTINTVSVSTAESGDNNQPGDLTLNGALDFDGAGNVVLSLSSHNNIILNETVSDSDLLSDTDWLTLTLNPDSDGLGGGAVQLNSIMGERKNTTINGDLEVGASGAYNLVDTDASLASNSIQNSGAITQTDGVLDAGSLDNDGTITQDGGTNTVAGALTNNVTGTYSLNDGTLNTDSVTNSGVMTQTAATSDANVTNAMNNAGSYTLTDGTLDTGSLDNDGTFTQNGGTNTVAGALNNNATGSYNLNDGTLNTDSVTNSGVMTQAAATSDANVTNSMSNAGSYTLTDGTLDTGSLDNDGTFTQNGGTNTVAGALNNDTTGAYDLNDGTLNADSISNSGTMTQTAATSDANVANTMSNAGSYTLTDGALNTGAIDNNGSFTQDGGSNTVAGALTIQDGGSYALNGGTLNVGSLLVSNLGDLSGIGTTVEASGDITDLRTSGSTGVSYTGADVGIASIVMDGDIIASESISLNGTTVNGVVTGTAMTLDGDAVLNGAVNLKPYVLNNFYNHSVITNAGGDSVITGDVAVDPLVVDRHLGTYETVDSATIDVNAGTLVVAGSVDASQMDMTMRVAAGSSLSLQGVSTSMKRLATSVGTGGFLTLGNTTASSMAAYGAGEFVVNGALVTGTAGTPGNVAIQSGSMSVNGANGAIDTNGGSIVVGNSASTSNTASLTIDYSANAAADRLGNDTNISLSTGSALTINGHGNDAVTEDAGSLVVNFVPQSYTRDYVVNVTMNGGGVTNVVFDDLQLVNAGTLGNRIDFATNGTFGVDQQIHFSSPVLLENGILNNTTINGQEFATYDNGVGIKSATTATNSFGAGGNIFVDASTAVEAGVSINSLAVANANVTGAGSIDVTSGKMLLSGASIINPAINLGAAQGDVLVTESSVLSGGINGTSGMTVNGGGMLELVGSGSMSGGVAVNSANLVLSSDNALQGADVTVHDSLSVGSTTQNVNSMLIESYADFAGNGSVVATGNINDLRTAGIIDADYQSLTGDVLLYADEMNGNVTAAGTATLGRYNEYDGEYYYTDYATINGSVDADKINAYGLINGNMAATEISARGTINGSMSATYISASGTINGSMSATDISASGTINGSMSGATIYASGTVNGDISVSNSASLSGTINGVISGAADVSVSGALTNTNTYTGSTSGSITLRGNGSIASSSSINGSIGMLSNDGEANVDRIGDTAQINLGNSGNGIMLAGSGGSAVGMAVSEDVGAIHVAGNAEVGIVVANSLNGTATLTADSLSMGSDSLVFVTLGNASKLFFDAAPASSYGVIDGVYIEKDISGFKMPTWAAYGTNGVKEAVVGESSIAAAGTNDFIRVTDATNAALTADASIGALNVDTAQTMSGAHTLAVNSGQIMFWKDNTIDIAQIDFGAAQGFIANAGTNVIDSVISGSNGLRKIGDGKLLLTAANTYTGTTRISGGEIEVQGSIAGNVDIANVGTLTLSGGGSVASISHNDGYVKVVNGVFNNAVGNNIHAAGYGNISIDANSSFSNAGGLYSQYVDLYGTGSASNSGYIYDLDINANRIFSNSGSIWSVYNKGTFTNTGNVSHIDNRNTFTNAGSASYASNYASFTNNGSISYSVTNNSGTFTNNGSIGGDISNYSGAFINNSSIGGDVSNGGAFTNDGSVGGSVYNSGNFINNAVLNSQHIMSSGDIYREVLSNAAGSNFTNNSDITIGQHGKFVNAGTFRNDGTFTITDNNNATGDSGGNVISGSFINRAGASLDLQNSDVELSGAITNRGSVNVDAGSTVSDASGTGSYLQQGADTLTVVNGRFEADMTINSGILKGAGYIAGDLVIGPNGTLQPGNSPGLLSVGGDLTLSGILDLEIGKDASGNLVYDRIDVGGSFTGGGRINISLGSGLDLGLLVSENPEAAPQLSFANIFTVASSPLDMVSLVGMDIRIDEFGGFQSGGNSYNFMIELDESGALVTSVEAVPVPAAIWLFGSGLIGLVGVARRRKAA